MHKLLTEEQVAALLEVSVKTLQGWRYRGGGPKFAKIGRLVRYGMPDIEDWVHQKTRRSTSEQPPVPLNRSGFTVRLVPEGERSFDRPLGAATSRPPTTPRFPPRPPTRSRHRVGLIRCRTRIILPLQEVTESAPRPAR